MVGAAAAAEKRARTEDAAAAASGSRLFEPYRALGYIASSVAHSVQYRGQAAFVTTGIGRSFHVYDAEKIRLLFVGPQFAADVCSVLSVGDETFVSAGGRVAVCRRGRRVGELRDVGRGEISGLAHFGDYVLGISEDNAVVVWERGSREVFTELEFESEAFRVTAVVHPSTYVNKIVVGSAQGAMQVWNIQTRRCLYAFGALGSAIGCLAQAPALDVLAVGLVDGRVVLHNIKQDRAVMQLAQEGRVTAVAFRTDDVPMMATANDSGDVALWDLDSRRLAHVIQGAHDAAVAGMDFLTGQPLLLTSSADNSIKEWLFDGHDGVPRLLRQRSGHFGPPQLIRYHGGDGRSILSAGRDRALRLFSVFRDEQSGELSQGALAREARLRRVGMGALRLPPVTHFASSTAMSRDWDDVLTCHQGSRQAHTWSAARRALGQYTLTSPDESLVRAAAISACGHFGLLGLASGAIEMVNMQSGLFRRTFAGHTKPVTGIHADACNLRLYSCALDGTLRAWDFATGAQAACIQLPAAASRMAMHADGGLLACACDDACVRVVDAESLRVVRTFAGHRSRITDLAFSSDGRWVVTGSLDSTVRTWDLPTGHMVDWFRTESVPVSVAFSPTGDFLATAHMDSVGIFLWANRTQFADVSLRQIDPASDGSDSGVLGAALVPLPTSAGLAAGDDDSETGPAAAPASAGEAGDSGVYLAPEQLTDNMVTLSALPRSKWQTLLNLATIKRRNMPEKAPRAPEQAPFFLPTVAGVEHRFDLGDTSSGKAKDSSEADAGGAHGSSKIISVSAESALARVLLRARETMAYAAVFDYLKELNPSAVDAEIRSLPVDDGLRAIRAFIAAVTAQLRAKRDFELAQAYLQVFLGVFADVLKAQAAELGPALEELRAECRSQWATVDGLIRYSACMVEFMRTAK
ncbi:rRNA-processing protein utp21 [Coemansia javaensis]|uniref:rRNA-processing protein utp21 n=1 Tax=Coemansia javaensis TaxID=2761396 RepID=A0A9W8HGY6_9FUNG|nr:rRNA-processing protein utp21 [Coemansia javaensis]